MSRDHRLLTGLVPAVVMLALMPLADHPQGRGQDPGLQARSGRDAAPYDLSGYWVALVTDDWRYRMLTPPRGNVDYLPVNAEARRVADAWDPARDEASGEACRAYGAAGVMRLPGRLQVTWEDDDTLRIDTDAGIQTRRFFFGSSPPPPPAEATWQGYSVARWMRPGGRGRGSADTGQLVVTTTRMRPGYLRKNGVPYGPDAVLTEFFVRLVDDAGQEYLAVTQMVADPQYLLQPYVKTYQFMKQPDASGWKPMPCSVR
jgi:hypothetical protein